MRTLQPCMVLGYKYLRACCSQHASGKHSARLHSADREVDHVVFVYGLRLEEDTTHNGHEVEAMLTILPLSDKGMQLTQMAPTGPGTTQRWCILW